MKAGLIALLSLMTMLLIMVSVIGVNAINEGSRSIHTLNQILGEELGSLANSSNLTLRARTAASLAVRQREIGQVDVSDATVGRIYGYLEQSNKEMARFVGVGTVTDRGRELSNRLQNSYRAYLEQGVKPMAAAIKAGKIDEYYHIQETRISALSIAFEKDLTDFRSFAMKLGAQQVYDAENNASTKISLIVVAGLLSVLLAVLAWFALRVIILRPLDESIAQLEHIAGGDLTHGSAARAIPRWAAWCGRCSACSRRWPVRSAKCVTPAARSTPVHANWRPATCTWRSAPKNRPLRWKRPPPAWNS